MEGPGGASLKFMTMTQPCMFGCCCRTRRCAVWKGCRGGCGLPRCASLCVFPGVCSCDVWEARGPFWSVWFLWVTCVLCTRVCVHFNPIDTSSWPVRACACHTASLHGQHSPAWPSLCVSLKGAAPLFPDSKRGSNQGGVHATKPQLGYPGHPRTPHASFD